VDVAPIQGLDVVGYAGALPFRNGSFHTVLCTSVLEHVDNAEEAVREIVRILRPGGRLLVTVPFLYPTHEAPYDYWRATHHGLGSVLERHGLVIDDFGAQGGPILLIVHYAVLALVQALRALSVGLGRFGSLVDNRITIWLLAAPQEIAGKAVSYRLSPLARVASLGYMAAAHLEPRSDAPRQDGEISRDAYSRS
jgi:SAM-dependent methyltransferase